MVLVLLLRQSGGAADFNRGIDSFEVVDDSPASPAAAASSSSSSSSSSSAMASRVCYFRIVGSSFLWHQVRCMVAVLFMVGRGQESSGIVRGEREGVGREKGWGEGVPACAACLVLRLRAAPRCLASSAVGTTAAAQPDPADGRWPMADGSHRWPSCWISPGPHGSRSTEWPATSRWCWCVPCSPCARSGFAAGAVYLCPARRLTRGFAASSVSYETERARRRSRLNACSRICTSTPSRLRCSALNRACGATGTITKSMPR
jgi:hypothetical protein